MPANSKMIETPRLILRPHAIDDFQAYAPLWAERADAGEGLVGFPPLREEEIWARLLRWIGHWHTFGFAPFVVVERASGLICGEVGYGHFLRGHGPAFDGAPEGMWTLHPDFHRRGLAIEATEAATSWFDALGKADRTVCMIDPANVPSLKLATRMGFVEFARSPHKGQETILLERFKPNYSA